MSKEGLPKLNTTNLNKGSQSEQPKSASVLQSPSTPFSSRSPLESTKSREKTKFKGVIDKFMGNFNGNSK
jgi:hypothetical protein